MDELSEETQAQINQIQFDEQQKLKGTNNVTFDICSVNSIFLPFDPTIHPFKIGQPTSDQIKQQELLRKAWDAEGSPFKGQAFDPNIVQFQN